MMSTQRSAASPTAQGASATTESTTKSRPTPVIEELLAHAYSELAALQATTRTLIRHGLAASALPSGDILLAIAVLGDHGRPKVEKDLLDHWEGLVNKGLVHGDLHEHSTPRLRLLLLVQPATVVLDGLRTRLESAAAQPAPPEVIRCASQVNGLMWGQRVRLDYWIDHAEYLLIVPSPAFRRLPVLIHTGGGAGHGNIELPGDEGEVVFTVMGNEGSIYRHTTVFTLRKADWLAPAA